MDVLDQARTSRYTYGTTMNSEVSPRGVAYDSTVNVEDKPDRTLANMTVSLRE